MSETPPQAPDKRRRRRAVGYHRVLIPISTTTSSQRGLDLACRLAADRHAHILALAVIEVPLDLPLTFKLPDEEKEAKRALAQARAIGESYGVNIRARIVRARETGTAILEETANHEIELIVLPTSYDPHSKRQPFGRTVQHVLKSATCRVMLAAEREPVGTSSPEPD
jgi:nucleotide-binding universal stress UspA family protein